MSSSLPGSRPLPNSQYDLSTYWGRVLHSAQLSDPRTLFVSSSSLENAKSLLTAYKQSSSLHAPSFTPDHWQAKKILDSTLHPDTGEPVLLPFRMSCFVLSNLIVTAGMLTPNLSTLGTLGWQITNQSLNVAINASNANKSTPLTTGGLVQSYLLAVSASCGVALGLNALVPRLKRVSPSTKVILGRLVPFAAVATAGALNVFLMRGEEIRKGIDIFPGRKVDVVVDNDEEKKRLERLKRGKKELPAFAASLVSTPATSSGVPFVEDDDEAQEIQEWKIRHGRHKKEIKDEAEREKHSQSIGKSKKAAWIAVAETAASRVFNATPIMVIPPLILVRLQKTDWLKNRPRMVLPINLGLILTTSIFALPLALGVFPQRQSIAIGRLEKEFWDKVDGGKEHGVVEFNRGI